MKESAIYQEILQEGEQRGLLRGKLAGKLEGKLEGKLGTIPLLKKLGLSATEISKELDIELSLVNQFMGNCDN